MIVGNAQANIGRGIAHNRYLSTLHRLASDIGGCPTCAYQYKGPEVSQAFTS
jgi:hypothetical protein